MPDTPIEIGPDIDTRETQYVHVVLGCKHEDKHPLCGADSLWGYFPGLPKDVTCPNCQAALNIMPPAWKDQDDKPLPEDPEIEAAFPTRSGRHDLYGEAMRLVGARYSKGGLVALVNALLHRIEKAKEQRDGATE